MYQVSHSKVSFYLTCNGVLFSLTKSLKQLYFEMFLQIVLWSMNPCQIIKSCMISLFCRLLVAILTSCKRLMEDILTSMMSLLATFPGNQLTYSKIIIRWVKYSACHLHVPCYHVYPLLINSPLHRMMIWWQRRNGS